MYQRRRRRRLPRPSAVPTRRPAKKLAMETIKYIQHSSDYTTFSRGEVDAVTKPERAIAQLIEPNRTDPIFLTGLRLPGFPDEKFKVLQARFKLIFQGYCVVTSLPRESYTLGSIPSVTPLSARCNMPVGPSPLIALGNFIPSPWTSPSSSWLPRTVYHPHQITTRTRHLHLQLASNIPLLVRQWQ
jgi:hypothetical protein